MAVMACRNEPTMLFTKPVMPAASSPSAAASLTVKRQVRDQWQCKSIGCVVRLWILRKLTEENGQNTQHRGGPHFSSKIDCSAVGSTKKCTHTEFISSNRLDGVAFARSLVCIYRRLRAKVLSPTFKCVTHLTLAFSVYSCQRLCVANFGRSILDMFTGSLKDHRMCTQVLRKNFKHARANKPSYFALKARRAFARYVQLKGYVPW